MAHTGRMARWRLSSHHDTGFEECVGGGAKERHGRNPKPKPGIRRALAVEQEVEAVSASAADLGEREQRHPELDLAVPLLDRRLPP